MRIVRLSICEPLETCEWIYYQLPVRIARPERFQIELDWANDGLILRDLGTPGRILVRIGDVLQELQGSELTTTASDLECAITGVWIRASVEERLAHPVAEAAQAAVEDLVGSCTEAYASAAHDRGLVALLVLAALERGALSLRSSLQAQAGGHDDVTAALARWTQASVAAITFIAGILDGFAEAGG
jgi:hypothetical protein